MQMRPSQMVVWKCEENGRENFGVQQLPLFNLLEPEYGNCICFSGIQGGRGLNTNVSKNLPERVITLLSTRALMYDMPDA